MGVNSFDVPTNSAIEVEIEVREGFSAGQRHVLSRFPIVIGRGKNVDLRLDDNPSDPTLSRRHLQIALEGGRVVISDLSTNGTWVGSRQLGAGEIFPVSGDEAIWLGPRTMIVVRPRGMVLPPLEQDVPMAVPHAPGVPALPSSKAAVIEELPMSEHELPATSSVPLIVSTLGAFSVTVGDTPVPDAAWQSRKAILLLTFLADNVRRQVPAIRVEQQLWPDAPESARQALQTAVSRVRRAFRSTPQTADAPDPVRYERTGYVLSPEYALTYDVASLESACETAERARALGLVAEEEAALTVAVALYQGDFLEGHSDEWVEARRRAILVRAHEASEGLAALRVQQGATQEAVRLYETVLERDPCREASQVGLIRALLRGGRREEAVRAYHLCVRTLKKLLGLPPSAELVALYESVRRDTQASPID